MASFKVMQVDDSFLHVACALSSHPPTPFELADVCCEKNGKRVFSGLNSLRGCLAQTAGKIDGITMAYTHARGILQQGGVRACEAAAAKREVREPWNSTLRRLRCSG